jgi:hypothetical protein
MSVMQAPVEHGSFGDVRHKFKTVGFALALIYAFALTTWAFQGHWLRDAGGQIIANDFVNVWAGGS